MSEEEAREELARLKQEYAELFHVDADLLEESEHRQRSGRLFQLTVRVAELQRQVGEEPVSSGW